MSGGATLRHPDESDQHRIAAVIDEWFAGRRVAHMAGRSWFRHVGSTSWLAADPAGGRAVGILLGYPSQDHPTEAVVHLLAVDPNARRRGVGRSLVAAFAAQMAARGVVELVALAWPGDPPAATFFRTIGFRPDEGPGTVNRFGDPAVPDHEAPGEDRIVFRRATDG